MNPNPSLLAWQLVAAACLIAGSLQGTGGSDQAPTPASGVNTCSVPDSFGIAEIMPLVAQSVEPLPEGVEEPFFSGLGDYERPIAVRGAEKAKAQQYFNQGLRFWYAFNMPESLQSFAQAARCDPGAPMPYAGIALAAGPDVNDPTVPCPSLKLCYVSAQIAVHKAKAQSEEAGVAGEDVRQLSEALRAGNFDTAQAAIDRNRGQGSRLQALQELCFAEAVAQRYACYPTPCSKCGLDAKYRVETDQTLAFSRAMKLNHRLFPDDQDTAVLAAFSFMQIRPWKWWNLDKTPTPEIETATGFLESVLAANPNHPGANHFYIHAMEEGPEAMVEKALPSARRMPKLMPGAGHFLHMPSHVYLNLGSYDLATLANEQAVQADRNYIAQVDKYHLIGRYPLHYLGHNLHFLAVTQSAQGQQARALATAGELVDVVTTYSQGFNVLHNKDQVSNETARFLSVPLTVSMQFDFAQWNEVKQRVLAAQSQVAKALEKVDAKNADLPFTGAMVAFGDALRAIREKDWDKALSYSREFSKRTAVVDANLQANSVASVYLIAKCTLIARAADAVQQEGTGAVTLPTLIEALGTPLSPDASPRELALSAWNAAIKLQDSLYYNDPPEWYYPLRQSLGAEYYRQGHFPEAEETFKEDLAINPSSPRSLHGLIESIRAQGKTPEPGLEEKFRKLWGENPLPSLKTM